MNCWKSQCRQPEILNSAFKAVRTLQFFYALLKEKCLKIEIDMLSRLSDIRLLLQSTFKEQEHLPPQLTLWLNKGEM